MSHVFPRHHHIELPCVASAEGCYLTDTEGRRYLDGSGAAAVAALGHGNAQVNQAMIDQLQKVSFAHTSFFTSAPAEALADKLAALAPGNLSRVYYTTGGSEAVEAALKLARQVAVERGEPDRHRIIARELSYHGNTLGALAAGGNLPRRKTFAPMLLPTSHIAPCHAWRDRQPGESDIDYGKRAAQALEAEILRLGAGNVLAFIAEPVVGATAGAVAAVPGYFKEIRAICDRYGVLLILDEVMCGMGRTGSLFACEQDDVVPDILTMAKGLAAGYQPLGAMMCTEEIYQIIGEGTGFFQHGHTSNGHPVACAAALSVVTQIAEPAMLAQINQRGDALARKLQKRFGSHSHVGDLRGRGLFRGLELVRDREHNTPFDPALKVHARIKKAAMAHGLICYPSGGSRDGVNGDHVLLAPPFVISEVQLDELVDKLSAAMDQVLEEVKAAA